MRDLLLVPMGNIPGECGDYKKLEGFPLGTVEERMARHVSKNCRDLGINTIVPKHVETVVLMSRVEK